MRVGPGADPSSQMGSLIDRANVARVQGLIDRAADEGDMVLRGKALNTGAFLTPTLFRIDDVRSPLVQDELFGPIVSIETFADEAEAVAKANATEYGLVAYLFTRDLSRGLRVSERLEFGMVGLNRGLVSDPAAPFGGVKQSGLGREGGHEGLMDFLETQYVSVTW